MKALRASLLALVVVLAGCVTGVQPQGFRQQLAYAESVHAAIIEAVDSSLTAGTVSSATAEQVAKSADESQTLLDAARQAYELGDAAGAQDKLTTALTALQALQDYMRAHGGKQP